MGTNTGESSTPGLTWLQESLFGEDVVEAVLRVGRVSDGGLWQFQVEVRAQPGNKLVGMRSWPGVKYDSIDLVSAEVLAEMVAACESMGMPF